MSSGLAEPIARVRQAAREVRARVAPDPRLQVLDLRARPAGRTVVLEAATTVAAAEDALRTALASLDVPVDLRVRLLPDPGLAPRDHALVRTPIAPVYERPTMRSTHDTQYVLGARLQLLSSRGRFFRIRGDDGHVGWVHRGYLVRGDAASVDDWVGGRNGEPAVSMGADIRDDADQISVRLPWGARVVRQAGGRILLPGGRAGTLVAGEVVAVDRLPDRFPPRGDSIVRTARGWIGAPYLWGGVTPCGVDCSGLVQSVCRMHGLQVPRDSDMQASAGSPVDPGPNFDALSPGDLLFFAEKGPVDHVALSLGGSRVLHASAGNGSVEVNDLCGDLDYDAFLRRLFVHARRLLPG